ncbi:Uncharacterised protein [Mycobacteroides abscessus]|nr:Uncharacterised protein [Mycobacteroides abscessus]
MHDALRDALAVELGELLDEVVVVQDDRAVGADGLRVGVRGDGRAGVRRGEGGGHGSPSVSRGYGSCGVLKQCIREETDALRVHEAPEPVVRGQSAQSGQSPQNVTSAVSIRNPAVLLGVRHGAWPTVQSTSATAPQPRHTTWWWLSPSRRS